MPKCTSGEVLILRGCSFYSSGDLKEFLVMFDLNASFVLDVSYEEK